MPKATVWTVPLFLISHWGIQYCSLSIPSWHVGGFDTGTNGGRCNFHFSPRKLDFMKLKTRLKLHV